MRAIPKKLLIHTVKLQRINSKDRWGDAKLDDGVLIEKVRIEPSHLIVRTKNSAEVRLAAVLFYDCRNSAPMNFKFKVDDIISFNGQKHKTVTVEPLYDEGKLHHYELGLVKYV